MTALLSNLSDSWGLTPPFDVVAFHDELARTHSRKWTFVMNADASIPSTKQNMTFTYASLALVVMDTMKY
ncbi:uncharacterized protein EV420DRAFT_1652215 [Desarmillaria tabescens]|uniref:Uncharacterized protein n=1 Tax=Armillaria tabescens TaxID=1929756 RepID=A0AA39MJZ5_ARMTA|nr:uncharacterized protein EV420DRAFT_1652215 [Desarmillaria tabescens]KAK0437087.1 hypothetical protein EV420DRAFT_1652215 [Desarmillaria tabescens]